MWTDYNLEFQIFLSRPIRLWKKGDICIKKFKWWRDKEISYYIRLNVFQFLIPTVICTIQWNYIKYIVYWFFCSLKLGLNISFFFINSWPDYIRWYNSNSCISEPDIEGLIALAIIMMIIMLVILNNYIGIYTGKRKHY